MTQLVGGYSENLRVFPEGATKFGVSEVGLLSDEIISAGVFCLCPGGIRAQPASPKYGRRFKLPVKALEAPGLINNYWRKAQKLQL